MSIFLRSLWQKIRKAGLWSVGFNSLHGNPHLCCKICLTHWLNKIEYYWDVARIHTDASLCDKLSHPAATYTLSVAKHKGSIGNGRQGCSTDMEFFSLKLKWNVRLKTGFSSWSKKTHRDQNKVLGKKKPNKNQQPKNCQNISDPKPWAFLVCICISIQSFSQFVEKFPTSCKQNVYVSWHLLMFSISWM